MNQETFMPREYTMADQAVAEERASFIVKTYAHLFLLDGCIVVIVWTIP